MINEKQNPTSEFVKMGFSIQTMTTSCFRLAYNLVFRERSLSEREFQKDTVPDELQVEVSHQLFM
jgi:hypothetical protein